MSRFRSLMSGKVELSLSRYRYSTTAKSGSITTEIYNNGLPLTENVTFSYSGDKTLTATKSGSTITIKFPATHKFVESISYVTINYNDSEVIFTLTQSKDTSVIVNGYALSDVTEIYSEGTYSPSSDKPENYYNIKYNSNTYIKGTFKVYDLYTYGSDNSIYKRGTSANQVFTGTSYKTKNNAVPWYVLFKFNNKLQFLTQINITDLDITSRLNYSNLRLDTPPEDIKFTGNIYPNMDFIGNSTFTRSYSYRDFPYISTWTVKSANWTVINNFDNGNFTQKITANS